MGMTSRRQLLQAAALACLASPALRVSAAGSTAARVVVVGGGFAGGSCALQLRRLDPALSVTLVDPDASYVTCPMSNAVLGGLRTLTSITTTRGGLAGAGVVLARDRVTGIDARAHRVRLQGGDALTYDRLVVAPGIRLLFGRPEGYDEAAALVMPHAWEAGAQTRLLARKLQALPPGGVVAISVPAGLMRCPPGPYERASLIANWLKQHRPRGKVLIYDANNHFPRQDLFMSAWQERFPGMIEWISPRDGGEITRVDARSHTLFSSSGAHTVAVANVIPPQAPGLLAVDAGLASGHGWCPVRPQTFESELAGDVHVIGDACIAGAMPKAASAAHSQALQCAAAVVASLRGRETPASDLSSVCYSFMAADAALAMRAHFSVVDGDIRQLPAGPNDAAAGFDAVQAREALEWYAQIRTASFGTAS
jgi:sulfide dehydrogenase [flavocytochrome c] flavoprotein chain